MRLIGNSRHKERVEAVVEVIKAITGQEIVSDDLLSKLNAMSFEELGALVMNFTASRSTDKSMEALPS